MNTSITEAYQLFPNKDQLSFSSFYKYIEDKYKHPHRLTDLCDYCEQYKSLRYKIKRSINELEQNDESQDPNFFIPRIDAENLISYYNNHPHKDERHIISSK
jgi:hypothetical protein